MNTLRCTLGVFVLPLALGCAPENLPPPIDKSADTWRQASGVASPLLRVGDLMPPLQAEGWVNGPPPVPGAAGPRLLVVDVWAIWCPYCEYGAPGLVRMYKKYAPEGVAFVGITNLPKDGVDNYARQLAIPWPNGYGATDQMIAALGAGSGMSGPFPYEVAPTLYVVGPDGRVRWTDSRGRDRHQDPRQWERAVDDAIANALRE